MPISTDELAAHTRTALAEDAIEQSHGDYGWVWMTITLPVSWASGHDAKAKN